jgi:hypothetical protein
MIPVSWGELLDKVTILEIKRTRLRSPDAVANVERELASLAPVLAMLEPMGQELLRLKAALSAVNQTLWGIEDAIREMEAAKSRWRAQSIVRTTNAAASSKRSTACCSRR